MGAVAKRSAGTRSFGSQLRSWEARRWLAAVAAAAATVIVVAIPTDMIDTPLFTRDIPVTWWAWPVLIINGMLAGLVAATYVARRDPPPSEAAQDDTDSWNDTEKSAPARRRGRRQKDSGSKFGTVGGIATFFAVGCPVCNKLVLIALGYTGAIQFFEPIQPYLALGAIALLGWAFVARVRRERSCPLPGATTQPQQLSQVDQIRT